MADFAGPGISQSIKVTNLIGVMGDFESDIFKVNATEYNYVKTSSKYKFGVGSIAFMQDGSAVELTYTLKKMGESGVVEETYALNKTHKYYFSIWTMQRTSLDLTFDCYWPIAEPPVISGIKNTALNTWEHHSCVFTRSSFSNGSYPLRIDCNNYPGSNAIMNVDGLMLVDLTDCFGSGKEPTKEWCDNNIPFTTGTVSIEINATAAAYVGTGIARKLTKCYLGIGDKWYLEEVPNSTVTDVWDCTTGSSDGYKYHQYAVLNTEPVDSNGNLAWNSIDNIMRNILAMVRDTNNYVFVNFDTYILKFYNVTEATLTRAPEPSASIPSDYYNYTATKYYLRAKPNSNGKAHKVKKGYVGVKTNFPIYENQTTTKTVNINNSNLSEYFEVTNGSYYFKGDSSSSKFIASNLGVNSSSATTTLKAKKAINNFNMSYGYTSEQNYDKFTFKYNSTTVENTVSGTLASKAWTKNLAAGDTLAFTYTKDGSVNANGETCWFGDMTCTDQTTTQVQVGTEAKEVARLFFESAPSTITFSVSGYGTYTVTEGSTWKQFINNGSSSIFSIDSNGYIKVDSNTYLTLNNGSTKVSGSSIITAGYTYKTMSATWTLRGSGYEWGDYRMITVNGFATESDAGHESFINNMSASDLTGFTIYPGPDCHGWTSVILEAGSVATGYLTSDIASTLGYSSCAGTWSYDSTNKQISVQFDGSWGSSSGNSFSVTGSKVMY